MSFISPENVIASIGRYLQVDVIPIIVDLEKSKGNRIFDAKSGQEFLDCFSYIATLPIGHNHPKMHDPAFEEKLLRAARVKPSNSDFWTVELAEFIDCFARLAMPSEFRHLFFIEGGTLAVENGLKVAFDWKVRKNQAKGRSGEVGTKIMHFQQAFHGRSGYCLSLTNTADTRKTKLFPKFAWPRVVNPKVFFPLDQKNIELAIEAEREAEKQILQAFADHPDDIAAIIIEPIQAEGGDNYFRPEFHELLRRLTNEYDAMLIYDEVQTGGGLTGKMWAYEHYGIVPDIVCFGKKMQVCGIMAGTRVDEVKQNVFVEASRLNSTWGGGLTDMVRSQRYLEIIDEDSLLDNAAKVGSYLLEQLSSLQNALPEMVSNSRGKGLLCAFDVPSSETRDKLLAECAARRVLVLKCGARSIRLRPSLTFTRSDVDELMAVLQAAVPSVCAAK